jgi:hypothetical protein
LVTVATAQLSAVTGVPKLIPIAVHPLFVFTFNEAGAVMVGLILSAATDTVPVVVEVQPLASVTV